MKYYRADTRKNIHIASPIGQYPPTDSGGRPDDCKKEIAFADSIGGALYGALQNLTSDDNAGVKPRDFLNKKKKLTLHVYMTDKKPTYEVTASHMQGWLHEIPDYNVTNEVRYCDQDVPVEEVCSCDILARDVTIAKTLLPIDKDTEYFDWDKELKNNEICKKDPNSMECIEEFEKLRDRVVAGDEKLIKKLLYKKPQPIQEIAYAEDVYGIDTNIARELAKTLEKRCK